MDMIRKCIYIILILLIVPFFSVGQSKILSKRSSPAKMLKTAESQKEKDPLKAISTIEQVIEIERLNKKPSDNLGKAYFLLGTIYEQIDQDELAENRYKDALRYVTNEKNPIYAKANYHLGEINLKRKNEKIALIHFDRCIQTSTSDDIRLKCEEAKADIKIMMNDNNAALLDLELLQKRYDLDSLSFARIEARKSKAYLNMKDYSNATNALQNSYNTVPRNTILKKEDVAELDKANEAFFSKTELSNTEKIDIQNTVNYSGINDDNLVRENFRKSKLFEEENETEKALISLEESKRSITANTSANLAAEVYEKSYKSNLELGNISIAFEDLQNYIKAKESEIEKLKKNLNQEIEIVKSQKKIDIAEKDFNLKVKDESLSDNKILTQYIIIGFLMLIVLALIIFFYFLFKNIRAKRRANQMLYLKSLRTQMNPHFIFNALNSVNNFIAQNDEKAANKFLADFSQLMRKVLDYSEKDFINIQDEIELNELYLKLEHFRFRDKFDYTFQNDLSSLQKLEIPPMLIQPFIENAIWHGLRYKEKNGALEISFEENEKHIAVNIKDNGIGREKSKFLKTQNQKKYNSTGLNNVSKRIKLINTIYNKNYKIKTQDLNPDLEDKGTFVEVIIPKD
ncbi:MAG: histidine kinase [Bacteroidota bacterium]